jgi:outer membrane protein TolC
MKHSFFILLISLLLPSGLTAREVTLTLDEAIDMARVRSVDAAEALDELKTAYWEWRTFRADQLPEVTLKATAPAYANQYTSYMNGDGEYSFVRSKTLEAEGQLSITQNVRLTGGTISLNSSIDFLRQFDGGSTNRFMSIPIAVTFNQPIFGVNTMKWDAKIEPVKYAEAKAKFLSATEDVAQLTVEYFFTLIMSRENVHIAQQNLNNAEKLYTVAIEKRKMGQISENDLLQMELNVLSARSSLTDYTSALKSSMFQLRTFLDLDEEVDIIPQIPGAVPNVEINYADALDKALDNNKFAKNMIRRQLEADYQVAKAKGNLREINLFAQLGYTGTDTQLSPAYNRLKANEIAQVGFSIPLLDWGKRRGKVKVAESNRRVTESTLRREKMDFNQEIFLLVERFTNQQQQLDIAVRSDEIAQKRYATNVETYLIGKISTLDLNDSQVTKDESRREYINELYKYWDYWYQLRSLTLYDWQSHDNINADIARLVKM